MPFSIEFPLTDIPFSYRVDYFRVDAIKTSKELEGYTQIPRWNRLRESPYFASFSDKEQVDFSKRMKDIFYEIDIVEPSLIRGGYTPAPLSLLEEVWVKNLAYNVPEVQLNDPESIDRERPIKALIRSWGSGLVGVDPIPSAYTLRKLKSDMPPEDVESHIARIEDIIDEVLAEKNIIVPDYPEALLIDIERRWNKKQPSESDKYNDKTFAWWLHHEKRLYGLDDVKDDEIISEVDRIAREARVHTSDYLRKWSQLPPMPGGSVESALSRTSVTLEKAGIDGDTNWLFTNVELPYLMMRAVLVKTAEAGDSEATPESMRSMLDTIILDEMNLDKRAGLLQDLLREDASTFAEPVIEYILDKYYSNLDKEPSEELVTNIDAIVRQMQKGSETLITRSDIAREWEHEIKNDNHQRSLLEQRKGIICAKLLGQAYDVWRQQEKGIFITNRKRIDKIQHRLRKKGLSNSDLEAFGDKLGDTLEPFARTGQTVTKKKLIESWKESDNWVEEDREGVDSTGVQVAFEKTVNGKGKSRARHMVGNNYALTKLIELTQERDELQKLYPHSTPIEEHTDAIAQIKGLTQQQREELMGHQELPARIRRSLGSMPRYEALRIAANYGTYAALLLSPQFRVFAHANPRLVFYGAASLPISSAIKAGFSYSQVRKGHSPDVFVETGRALSILNNPGRSQNYHAMWGALSGMAKDIIYETGPWGWVYWAAGYPVGPLANVTAYHGNFLVWDNLFSRLKFNKRKSQKTSLKETTTKDISDDNVVLVQSASHPSHILERTEGPVSPSFHVADDGTVTE